MDYTPIDTAVQLTITILNKGEVMTEILFVLTTIFVAYVAHSVYSDSQGHSSSSPPPAKPETAEPIVQAPAPIAASITQIKPKQPAAVVKAKKPSPTKAKAKTPAPAPSPVKPPVAQTLAKATVRDPLSGEVASITSNYRFTKRWIKDALVTEGLLDKVYTNKDLNPEAEAVIKAAMGQLASMEKYQG